MKEIETKWLKYARILWTIVIITGVCYLFLGQIFLPNEKLSKDERCEEFHTDWVRVEADGTYTPIEIPGKCEAEEGENVTVETVLPKDLAYNTYLRFWSLRQDMKIYIDGSLRESYSTEKTRIFGKTSSPAFVFVELSPKDSGKKLTVVTKTYSVYSGVFRTVYIGDKQGIWKMALKRYGAEFFVALFMLVLSLFSIIMSKAMSFYYKHKVALEYLGWGVLVVAMWLLLNSVFRQILFRNISTASDVTFLCIMLLPIPFLLYMNRIQNGRYKKHYERMTVISMMILLICILLQVTNTKDFAEIIFWVDILVLSAMVFVVVTMIIDWKRGEIKDYYLIAVGIAGVCVAGMAQIYLYARKIELPFSGSIMAIGLVFLLILAVISTIKSFLRIEYERSQALHASEAKARFLANMSHEIRTPINAILGMDEIILRESKERCIKEYALDIQNAGRSLIALINDILDFSKIESGKLEILPVEYDLSELMSDCYSMIQMRANEKGLTFRIENDSQIPRRLLGDEIRVRQIIINLLTNAVKYTQEGSVVLSVNGKQLTKDTVLLKVSVKDTGIGIDGKDQKKLFELFQRVEEQKNRNIEGTGLGLAITKQLVDLMQGTIEVESIYGEGSVFTVEIPQTIVSSEAVGDLSENYQKSHICEECQECFRATEGKILAVDDVPMNLKVIRGLLKNTGLQIDTVRSGQECIDIVQKKTYHMIFLDHMMPKMDGVETLEIMKELPNNLNKNTPVIMLTANAVQGAKEQYLSAGFVDYLAKPINEKCLEEMILKYLPKELVVHDVVWRDNTQMQKSFLERLEYLDVKKGMRCCANSEKIYQEVLLSFLEDERRMQLQKSYEQNEWEDYCILTHGLKSAAQSIGAVVLSEKAARLEQAVKEKNIADIRNEHKAFVDEYTRVLECIEKVFS